MIAQIPIPSHLQPLRSIPPAIIHSTHNEHSQNPPTQSAPLTSPSPEAEEPTLNSPFPDTPSKRKRGRPLGAWGRKRRRTEHISQRRELSKLMKEDDVLKNKLEQQALLEKRKENRVKKIVESLVLPETVWQNQKNQSPPHPPAGPIATEPEPKEDIAGDSSNSFPWSDETTPPIKPEPLPKEDSPPKTPVALPPPPILDIVVPSAKKEQTTPQNTKKATPPHRLSSNAKKRRQSINKRRVLAKDRNRRHRTTRKKSSIEDSIHLTIKSPPFSPLFSSLFSPSTASKSQSDSETIAPRTKERFNVSDISSSQFFVINSNISSSSDSFDWKESEDGLFRTRRDNLG